MPVDERYDEEDLSFLSGMDRLEALGLAMDSITHEPRPISAGKNVGLPKQRPSPGIIEVRLADVARKRGLVHKTGPFQGHVSTTALVRGTDISYTTVIEWLKSPENLTQFAESTLSRLCDFLECQPGDLLVYKKKVLAGTRLSDQYKTGTE